MRRSLLISLLLVAATLIACDEDPIAPPTTGSISLRIITRPNQPSATGPQATAPADRDRASIERIELPPREKGIPVQGDSADANYLLRGVPRVSGAPYARRGGAVDPIPRARSAQAADRGEPPRSSAAPTAIDEATITVYDAIGTEVARREHQTPGSTVTIDGLQPSTYTVVLEGLVAGEVDHFGRTQVTVVAGQNRTATISFNSFRPTINAPQSPTTLLSFWVTAPTVAAADSYFTEQDTDPGFTNPDTLTVVDPSVWVLVGDQDTYYFRARAINDWVPRGRPSDVVSVQIVTDLVASGGSYSTAPSLGFGEAASTVLTELNILPAGDEDWFALDACALDTLIADMFASVLDPPSVVDSYLELYDATGTVLIDWDDDSGNLLDSYLETVLPTDGTYYVKARGYDSEEIGNYELAIDLRRGPNNNGTSCSGGTPVVQTGPWEASTGFGQMLFTVNDQGTGITEITYVFSSWTCGGVTRSGSIRVSTPPPGWPITDGQFTIHNTMDANLSFTVSGTFTASDVSSGSWSAVSYGSTCSGTWQGAPEPPSADFSPSPISAGYGHSCAVTETGAAYCWGFNDNGELGDGTYDYSPSPVLVSGALDFQAIHASTSFSCGLTTGGAAHCWGRNDLGQLGDGSYADSPVPVAVSGGYTFESITAGPGTGLYACGLDSNGTAYCWGANHAGQLGDGTYADSPVPVGVSGGHTFLQLAAGHRHTCGIVASGAAYCWGLNDDGQLGTGTYNDTTTVPVAVTGGHVFESITAGRYQTCAVTTSGAAYCWGQNSDGQLGDGGTTSSSVPAAVVGGVSFESVSAGRYHTCGLTSGGAAYCWGYNDFGQLGDASDASSNSPAPVSTGLTFRSVSAGSYHTCAATDAGEPYCWGVNRNGQLGSSNTPVVTPTAVSGGLSLQMIESGLFHSCGVAAGGTAYCWGVGLNGQIGNAAYATSQPTPVAVSGVTTFQSVSAGGYHSCGVTTGQEAYCWGYNGYGALGDNTTTQRGTPVLVTGGLQFSSSSAGAYHTCGVTSGGEVYCWGRNYWGQVGDGGNTDTSVPVLVGVPSVQSIAVGRNHSCALTTTGDAYCWGANGDGQLGNGTTSESNIPVLVSGGPFHALTAGRYHTCGVDLSGVAYCWGYNGYGEYGDGTFTVSNTPVLAAGGMAFESVSAGYRTTCGITSGNLGYCWGYNRYGQGGNGTQVLTDLTPTVISGALTVQQVTNDGFGYTCALTTSGAPYCWGYNAFGQLGNGTVAVESTPVLVAGGLVLRAPVFAATPVAPVTESGTTALTRVRRR